MSLSPGLTFSVVQYQAGKEEQEQEAEREAICKKTPPEDVEITRTISNATYLQVSGQSLLEESALAMCASSCIWDG
jgi:hypothetical protein